MFSSWCITHTLTLWIYGGYLCHPQPQGSLQKIPNVRYQVENRQKHLQNGDKKLARQDIDMIGFCGGSLKNSPKKGLRHSHIFWKQRCQNQEKNTLLNMCSHIECFFLALWGWCFVDVPTGSWYCKHKVSSKMQDSHDICHARMQ